MTAKRRYNAQCHACKVDAICPKCGKPVSPVTEFSDWARTQPEIDSSLGFVPTNIDFMWRNYKTKKFMLIEEKRHNASVKNWQMQSFQEINKSIVNENYLGFYIVRFQNTSPDNGSIKIEQVDGKIKTTVSRERFLNFLKMEWKR